MYYKYVIFDVFAAREDLTPRQARRDFIVGSVAIS